MQNSYIDDVIMSRRLLNNMVNLMNHQERNIRLIINQRSTQSNPYSYFINSGERVNPGRQGSINTIPINQSVGRTNRPQTARSTNIENTPIIQLSNLFTPSRVTNRRPDIPSALEIHNATRSSTYSNIEGPQNTVCPITREPFNDNDEVTQIIHCGHVFTRTNLYQWFNRSSVCPMCRHDIRNNTSSNAPSNAPSNTTSNASSNTPSNNERNSNRNRRNSTRRTNNSEENMLTANVELTNIAEQIANDILNNLTDSPSISLEYTLEPQTEINSTNIWSNNNADNNSLTHRTTYDTSYTRY